MSKISGIYCITNVSNGMFYLGSSVDIGRRRSSHFRELKKGVHANEHLQRSFIKYGENSFVFSVVETCHPDLVKCLENLFLNRVKICWDLCFNICDKSIGGPRMVADRHPMFGKTHTEQTRRKLSKAHIGKTRTEEHKRAISKALQNRSFSKEHKIALSEAASNRIYTEKERDRFRGESNHRYGKSLSKEHKARISTLFSKKIRKLESIGTPVATYPSLSEAAKSVGLASGSHIGECARGHRKTAGGFRWEFIDE